MASARARLCLTVTIGLVLAACGTGKAPDEVNPNILPAAYKQEILDALQRTLAYPTNVRDAYISEPVLTPIGTDQRYMACVRYNARDGEHRYAGSKDRIAYFYGGHLNQLVEPGKEECAKAAFKPFPELEKLCFAAKCP